MTPNEFEEFLDALDRHGGRLEDWPPALRAKADAIIATQPVAARQLAAARRVETALYTTRATAAPAVGALVARAMQARQDHPRRAMARRISWGVAGALALISGFYVGSMPRMTEGPSEFVAAALDQSGGHDVW